MVGLATNINEICRLQSRLPVLGSGGNMQHYVPQRVTVKFVGGGGVCGSLFSTNLLEHTDSNVYGFLQSLRINVGILS